LWEGEKFHNPPALIIYRVIAFWLNEKENILCCVNWIFYSDDYNRLFYHSEQK